MSNLIKPFQEHEKSRWSKGEVIIIKGSTIEYNTVEILCDKIWTKAQLIFKTYFSPKYDNLFHYDELALMNSDKST